MSEEDYQASLLGAYVRGFSSACDNVVATIDRQLDPIERVLNNVSPRYVFKETTPEHFHSMKMGLRHMRRHVLLLKNAVV